MPEFNKSRGFKLKGFSYPGKSPLKGKKKTADLAAADEARALAEDQIDDFKNMKMESTDLTAGGDFAVNLPSPAKQPTEAISSTDLTEEEKIEQADKQFGKKGVVVKDNEETDTSAENTSKAGGMNWSEVGTGLAAQLGGALANAAIEGVTKKKKKKPVKKGPDTSGFNKVKFGN